MWVTPFHCLAANLMSTCSYDTLIANIATHDVLRSVRRAVTCPFQTVLLIDEITSLELCFFRKHTFSGMGVLVCLVFAHFNLYKIVSKPYYIVSTILVQIISIYTLNLIY